MSLAAKLSAAVKVLGAVAVFVAVCKIAQCIPGIKRSCVSSN